MTERGVFGKAGSKWDGWFDRLTTNEKRGIAAVVFGMVWRVSRND